MKKDRLYCLEDNEEAREKAYLLLIHHRKKRYTSFTFQKPRDHLLGPPTDKLSQTITRIQSTNHGTDSASKCVTFRTYKAKKKNRRALHSRLRSLPSASTTTHDSHRDSCLHVLPTFIRLTYYFKLLHNPCIIPINYNNTV